MLSKQLEGIIKLIRREVNIMGKPILMHRITANSEEEVDRLSHEWFKKMRGKIEVLDTKSSEYKITPLVAILLLSYKLYAQTPHYHNIFYHSSYLLLLYTHTQEGQTKTAAI